MLAISVRVRPSSDLCWSSSEGRVTVTWPFSCATAIAAGRERVSSPLGPFTEMTLSSLSVTVTPFGTETGAFPIRDIGVAPLPDESEKLTARARLTRLTVGHQPLRRGQDRDAEAVPHTRDLGDADVLAKARGGDPLQRADDRLAPRGVLEPHAEQLLAILGLDRRVILNLSLIHISEPTRLLSISYAVFCL